MTTYQAYILGKKEKKKTFYTLNEINTSKC